MRTTLDIDDDVLTVAKELAAARGITVGQVVSELARTAMMQAGENVLIQKNGFWVLPSRGGVVTSERVKRLTEA